MLRYVWSAFATFAVAISMIALPSKADDFDRVVTFGDSLSDPGNLPIGSTGYPAPFDTLPRFTSPDGITWVERLAPNPTTFGAATVGGAPVDGDVNFAFGGAVADGALFVAGIPTTAEQIGAFLAPNPFGVGGTFGANDLVTVWAGANDAFLTLGTVAAQLGGGAITQEQAQAAIIADATLTASEQGANVQTLVGAGAKNILVPNLPDLGAAPSFNGSPATSVPGTLSTATYNDALAKELNGIAKANPNVNIIQMDVAAALGVVVANPQAFGFSNVTDACIATPSCAADPSQFDSFLFWDTVHPTDAGHALLAQFALLLLNFDEAADEVSAVGESALFSQLEDADRVFGRATSWLTGSYAHQNGFYGEVVGTNGEIDGNSASRNNVSYTDYGVRLGLDRQFGSSLVGGSFSIMAGDFDTGVLSADTMSFQGNLYGATYLGPLYAAIQGGLSHRLYNDISRVTGFGPVDAIGETESMQYGAAVEVGGLFDMGALALLPSARVGRVQADVDGYDETAQILALSYQDYEVSTNYWSAKLRASVGLNETVGLPGASAFVEGGYEDFFSYDGPEITASLVDNTALPATVTTDDPAGRGGFVRVGMNGSIHDLVAVDANYGVSFGDSGDTLTHTGKVRVKVPLQWDAAPAK